MGADLGLLKFKITPQVVKANQTSVITIESLDRVCRFFDGIKYQITFTAKHDYPLWEEDQNSIFARRFNNKVIATANDGQLVVENFFYGEQEWGVEVKMLDSEKEKARPFSTKNKNFSGVPLDKQIRGFTFSMYSLEDDLYNKRPFKGDLHVHTNESDGCDSPEIVASQFRKFGYDFICITDHAYMQSSLDAIEIFKNTSSRLKIFPGEEVHLKSGGIYHVVNFNPKTSVNVNFYEEEQELKEEASALSEKFDGLDPTIKKQLGWYQLIYNMIKDAGGICVYPHSHWSFKGAFNVRERVSEQIIKNKMCDCFELLGASSPKDNAIQLMFYQELISNGVELPYVCSSDAHGCFNHGSLNFDERFTIVFAEDLDKIPDNILSKSSVGVDNLDPNNKRVFANPRLTKYALFLLENYYDFHDMYCNAIGQATLRLVTGDKEQDDTVKALENELEKFNKTFFGR